MRKNRSQKRTLCEPRGISQSVHSLSRVWLFATPRTAACQASLSITNSHSPPRPMSTESVMPLNHLILCRPLLLLPSIFPSIRVFSSESALCIRWFLRVQNLGVRQHCFHRHVLTGVFNLLEAWKESESISHSVVSDSATSWTVAHQAPPSMGSSRQECWVAISFSRGSSQPRDVTQVSCSAGRSFTISATREAAESIYISESLQHLLSCTCIEEPQENNIIHVNNRFTGSKTCYTSKMNETMRTATLKRHLTH